MLTQRWIIYFIYSVLRIPWLKLKSGDLIRSIFLYFPKYSAL